MPPDDNDPYQQTRDRILQLIFGKKIIGVLLALTVLALVASSFILGLAEKAKKLFSPRRALEIVELSEIDNATFPILDLKLRNPGNEVAFLKRIVFEVLKTRPVPAESHMSEGAPVSHQYNVLLNPFSEDYTVPLSVSQEIPANGTDRIQIIIGADAWRHAQQVLARLRNSDFSARMDELKRYHIHRVDVELRLHLHYNENDRITSQPFVMHVGCLDYFTDPPRIVGATFEERLAALDDKSPTIRKEMARILGNLGNKRAVPKLLSHLSEDNLSVVEYCVLSLGKLQATEALPRLQELLNTKFESNRIHRRVVQALSHMQDERAVPILKRTFKTSDVFVRENIIESLRQLGSDDLGDLVPILIADLDDDRYEEHTARMLGDIGDLRALQPLTDLLKKHDCYQVPCYVKQAVDKLRARVQEEGTAE